MLIYIDMIGWFDVNNHFINCIRAIFLKKKPKWNSDACAHRYIYVDLYFLHKKEYNYLLCKVLFIDPKIILFHTNNGHLSK